MYWINSREQPIGNDPPAWVFGERITTHHSKNWTCYEKGRRSSDLERNFSGCETWCVTLREKHRLRVFENRVVREIIGHKRDDVAGDLWRLYIEELCNMYSSPDITGTSQIGLCCTELDIECH